MGNAVYPIALKGFLDADIDMSAHDIKVVLLDVGYVYSAAHDFLDDISGGAIVATSGNLASKTTTAGVFDAADVTFSSLTGDDVVSIVGYRDSGSSATSQLIWYMDLLGSGVALEFSPDGTDATLRWSSSGIFRI